jgi:hypothetical protein
MRRSAEPDQVPFFDGALEGNASTQLDLSSRIHRIRDGPETRSIHKPVRRIQIHLV